VIDINLESRTALITRTNQGISVATVRALTSQGVRAFLTYLWFGPDDPGVQSTALESYAAERRWYAQETGAEG
jgi:NAD(P)-dependent dehydrogenase (short-subunit alcohol dehydrogenase family)